MALGSLLTQYGSAVGLPMGGSSNGGLGDALGEQVAAETDEERRRRLQRQRMLGAGSQLSPVMRAISGSPLGAYGR
jgi:hypothetical protein